MNDLLQLLRTEISGAWRYRWAAIVTAWIACVLGWIGVLSMPDIFQARAQVYVDADSRLADVMEEVGVAPGVGSRVYIVRQAMLGRPQLERVARETDMDLRARTAEEKEELITDLRETIDVMSGRTREDRNLFTITFKDRDRDMAIAVVQALLDTFVEDVLELKERGSEDVTDFLEDQLKYYSDLLSEAEKGLAEFKKEYVGLLPGENGGVFERLQAEMAALKALQTDLQTETERRKELRRQLRSDSPYLPEGAVQANGTPVPGSAVENDIKELESRRGELLLTYTERYPDVVAIDEQLEQLYKKREAERAALVAEDGGMEGVSHATNPVYQTVQITLNESGVRIATLRSQIAQREAVVKQLDGQIDTIPEVEARYSELTRNYEQYRTLYNQLLSQKERERMGNAGSNRDVVSFNIIDPPAAEIEPVAPRRLLLLAGVLLLGLGAGGAMAFFLHQLHPVFYDMKTLRNVTGRPVLGMVSMTWLDRQESARRIDMSSFVTAAVSLVIVFVMTVVFNEVGVELMRSLIRQVSA